MNRRRLSDTLLVLGVVLLGAAVYAGLNRDRPGVTIEQPEREFPAFTPGQTADVAFRIHNPTRHTVQIVGLAEC